MAYSTQAPGSVVLVAGATGGVGQIVTAKLLERGYKVRAISRKKDPEAFAGHGPELEIVQADLRDVASITASGIMDGVDAVCCATGTTAFPSARWKGDNGPEQTDLIGASNFIKATPKDIKRFVFVTSAGVMRQGSMPWAILNLFGVLKFKRQAEELLEKSGLPYTIIRPSRLTDGPYTSYDLNTLLKSTAGTRQAVELSLSDSLLGEASQAVVQALLVEATTGKAYALSSTEGDGPGTDTPAWEKLFSSVDE
eukprot:gene2786-12661_t